jgi:DNA anti-recombination protein RmuC
VYKKGDIKTILKIKRLLYDERYTIEGAKKQLEEDEDRRTKEERLTEEIIRLKTTLSSIRADLIDLTNILSGG